MEETLVRRMASIVSVFEFLKLQLQRLCGDFLFRACKTEFFLAVEILTADFSNNPSPYCVSRKTTTVYRQARYDFASSKFKIRAEKNKERYGSVAAAKALPRSQNSTR